MLHVFLVDIGIMLKFEMELAVDSVSRLMEAVQQAVFIPANKQVLLSANGEPLNPTNRVASYPSAGTETQPIYLFSKSTIESPIPPPPGVNLRSEASLKEEVEASLQMKPKYETLVARAKLALDFQRIAVELGENCENLLNDQILQKKGWTAVIKNLDHITSAFKSHLGHFEQLYNNFQEAQLQYHNMLQSFHHVFTMLRQLPLFDCLPGIKSDTQLTLLQWIDSHDQQSSLDNLVTQCKDAIEQCKLSALGEIMTESRKVLDFVDNGNMRDIKGLEERLTSLEHRVKIVQQLVQDQKDMAQGFQQNQMRAEHLGDPSVLPDLCASHQKQLIVLLKNQHQIRDIHNLCAKAKDELSANLHARLRWVMYVERSIYEHDSKLLVYLENLRRIKKRLDILEQVYEAPRMYVCAVLEVMRRKNFSAQFTEWCLSVSQSSIAARTEELAKRKTFQEVFNNHFVKTLFPGIEYEPPPFAEEPFLPDGDDILPTITVEDIQLLQQRSPELMSEINLGDPLVTSVIVRDTFSQSNLSKLIDPRQNKMLEETINLREKTQVNNKQLTMSMLKREMSYQTEDNYFADHQQFEIDGIKEESKEEDLEDPSFEEPLSLKSLPENKRLTMSDDSDALFHSAELDFSCSEGSLSSIKSPHSGKSSKSSSSPIAIKGLSSFHKLTASGHCRSLSYHDNVTTNEKENVFSLPVLTTSEFIKSISYDGSVIKSLSVDSSASINCRSLSEAIKSTEVIENIVESADLVKISRQGIMNLRKNYDEIRGDIENIQNHFVSSLSDIKSCLTDVLKNDLNSCKRCSDLQEEVMLSSNVQENDDLLLLKEQYLEVISEKDKIFMQHTSLEEKLNLLTEENIKLKEIVYNLETEMMILKTEHEKANLELAVKNSEVSVLSLENSKLNEGFDRIKFDLTIKDDIISSLNIGKEKLFEELERSNFNLENKNSELSDLTSENEKLMKESTIVYENLQKHNSETEELKNKLESLQLSCQLSNDEHIEQVSLSNIQIKELRKFEKDGKIKIKEQENKINKLDNILSEKEQQLFELLQRKDSLEVQNQTNFNIVVNKIRKEKDTQINELKTKMGILEKETISCKHKNEILNEEINVHKSAYTVLQDQLDTQKDRCTQYEHSLSRHSDIFAENDLLKLKVSELADNVEMVKGEKLRVIQELKVQYDEALEKEKASLLLAFELEKCALEEYGKSEMVIRSTKSGSIEEGIDELEIERLLEKVKTLEEDNSRMKSTAGPSSEDNISEVSNLINKLKSEKLVVRNIVSGSLVILCLDDIINQYTVLQLSSQKYFLHPDSLKVARKMLERPNNERRWMFAYVTDIEICVCKKANNKFNLPVNSYFTRIRINPYEMESL